MSIKPIIFNTDMVRAMLEGRKTVTRRVVKPQPENDAELLTDSLLPETEESGAGKVYCFSDATVIGSPYRPGDIMYVRETFKRNMDGYSGIDFGGYIYKADCRSNFKDNYNPWRPSIHMPKEAARIFLKVTNVRVERLQEITDEQAKAEGANWKNGKNVGFEEKMRRTSVERFAEIWDSTIKKSDLDRYGWDANPWVLVIEFERCEKPEGWCSNE